MNGIHHPSLNPGPSAAPQPHWLCSCCCFCSDLRRVPSFAFRRPSFGSSFLCCSSGSCPCPGCSPCPCLCILARSALALGLPALGLLLARLHQTRVVLGRLHFVVEL